MKYRDQVVAQRDHEPRRQGQLGAQAREQRGEGRDDLPQNHADHQAGDHHHRDRVDHRGLDLAGELDRLLDVGGQPLENRVEDAAGLAGRDHVREQRVERLRMLAHRVGQRRAALDVGPRLQDDGGEVLVLLLGAEDLEALHEGQAGVDHHRELPREHREVLRRGLLPQLAGLGLRRRRGRLLLGRVDPRDEDLLAPERGDRRVHRVGGPLAAHRLSRARPSGVCESRHVLPQNQNSKFQIPNS